MTFISFPIAHSPHPVNHPSYVFPITLLILQNDTPDIASPPTYYATRATLRLPETFALLPHLPPSTFGTKVPCLPIQPMHPVLMCSTSYPVPRWRDARACDAGARKQGSQAHVDSPSHPSEPSFPTHLFHVKHARTIKPQERESPTAPGLPAPSSRPPSCSLRSPSCAAGALRRTRARGMSCRAAVAGMTTHLFHVKQESIVLSPARAHSPRGCRLRP